MRTLLSFIFCTFSALCVQAQSPIGAWEHVTQLENNETQKSILVFAEGFLSHTNYNATTGEFLETHGGSWYIENDQLVFTVEFNTAAPEKVGSEVRHKITVEENELKLGAQNTVFTNIDHGQPGELQGAWLMSGRVRDGEIQQRDTNRPRKTMKILSGTRFQWIAYNTETKEFMGTGGGVYTTNKGKYTENIEFFSRDISRVGMRLEFNYEFKNGHWHHSGKSSKGNPIHEIWSTRKE